MTANRRQFLNTAGAAAIYKFVDSGFTMKAASANDQIGMGFIGSGVRGTYLLGQFQDIPGVRPIIVADLWDGHRERVKQQTHGVAATTKDYEKVLNHPQVDAVVIATPEHWHKEMVIGALEAGKNVYVEKPMTWSVEEGIEIMEAVDRTGKLLQVGSQDRSSAAADKARELVANGTLGQVTMIRMSNNRNTAEGAWVWPIPPGASPQTVDWDRFLGSTPKRAWDPKIFFRWRCWWAYSGGVATDLFVHLLTELHYIMNVEAPKTVVTQGGLYYWRDGRNVPDVMNSIYEYDGFIVDMYVHLANAFSHQRQLIMGTKATLDFTRGDKLVVYPEKHWNGVQHYGINGWPQRLKAEYWEARGYTADGKPKKPLPPAPQPKEIELTQNPSHQERFIMSLREGKPSVEDAKEGHCAAGASHIANIAYRKGRKVAWDADTARVQLL